VAVKKIQAYVYNLYHFTMLTP